MKKISYLIIIYLTVLINSNCYAVKLKDLVRIQGEKPITIVGYGIVVGLGGTGDSSRNRMTVQSLKNTLSNFGVVLNQEDILSRNVAAVMVTAKISSFAEKGDQFDIFVSSVGDARSLTGGTLVLTPLYNAEGKIYAFSQGQLTVGGYVVDQLQNSYRKNHFTMGKVVKGATMERELTNQFAANNELSIILNNPDYTTVTRIEEAVIRDLGVANITAEHSGKLSIVLPEHANKIRFISLLENIDVVPEQVARVVVNEKTGTIVSGGGVVVSEVTVAHGNLKIEVNTRYSVSQPSYGVFRSNGIQTAVTPEVDIRVNEEQGKPVGFAEGTNVSTLVRTLTDVGLTTRDIITILQSIKTAGALHADLIIE